MKHSKHQLLASQSSKKRGTVCPGLAFTRSKPPAASTWTPGLASLKDFKEVVFLSDECDMCIYRSIDLSIDRSSSIDLILSNRIGCDPIISYLILSYPILFHPILPIHWSMHPSVYRFGRFALLPCTNKQHSYTYLLCKMGWFSMNRTLKKRLQSLPLSFPSALRVIA